MRFSHTVAALFVQAAFFLPTITAGKVDLDDIPTQCTTACRPLTQLARACDNALGNDQDEINCICSNTSIDVASVTSQCANCINQNMAAPNTPNDPDDTDDEDGDGNDAQQDIQEARADVNELMSRCNFQGASFDTPNNAPNRNLNYGRATSAEATNAGARFDSFDAARLSVAVIAMAFGFGML